jgi:hypothetical protein
MPGIKKHLRHSLLGYIHVMLSCNKASTADGGAHLVNMPGVGLAYDSHNLAQSKDKSINLQQENFEKRLNAI